MIKSTFDIEGGEQMYLFHLAPASAEAVQTAKIKHRLEIACDVSKQGVWEWRGNSQQLIWDKNMFTLFGYEENEIKPSYDFFLEAVHPEDRAFVVESVNKAYQGEIDYDIDFRVQKKCGTYITIKGYGRLDYEEKEPVLVGVNYDISEEKALLHEVNRTNARLASFLQVESVFVVRTDMEGKYTFVNESYRKRFHTEASPVGIGSSSMDNVLAEDHEKVFGIVQDCIQNPGQSFQLALRKRTADQGIRELIWEFICIQDPEDGGYEIQCTGLDITQAVQMDRLLQQKTRELAQLFSLLDSSICFILTDTKGEILAANPFFQHVSQRTESELVGSSLYHLFSKTNGKPLPPLAELLTDGKWQGEFYFQNEKKDALFFLATAIETSSAGSGVDSVMWILHNHTDKRRAEMRLKEYAETLKEKNEALLRFANIISHHIRSQAANLEMIVDAFHENPEAQETYLGFLRDTSTKLNHTIAKLNELLTINANSNKLVPVPLGKIWSSLQQQFESDLNTIGATLHITEESYQGEVQGDPNTLLSIFTELLKNAIAFRKPEHPLHIAISTQQQTEQLLIQIKDNGMGLDTERLKSKLFTMYQTFHANSHDGFGLYMVKALVDSLKGRIALQGKPGEGLDVHLYLPLGRGRGAEKR
ncbi:histidine kinase sensor protein [Nitritalea halalkaliphila LW7]|uniref:histidine kinase n=1 Tax=Nitritalea halalkaliphila LW7 TaxID=1189621 RepID=I5C7R8_9BACT|nr:PAS domain-containing sensor histidine kinase [Nitritalea halalkaliphila]EIM77870.1 histidine kinase sensor protein [Nitritalea halalkaliphila LW7]